MEEPRNDLDDVRSELKRLGYLSDRFDRFLLQDALRPRTSARALAVASLRVAVLGGVLVAAVVALGLAWVNGNLSASPFDLFPLFLHLLIPSATAVAVVFALLSSLLLGVLVLFPVRRIETLSLSVALVVGAGTAVLLLARVVAVAEVAGLGVVAVAAALGALVVAAVVKVVHAGLLALAVRWTRVLPERRAASRSFNLAALLVVALFLVLPPLLAVGRGEPPRPAPLPSQPGERVLLVGVDGILAEELEYLLEAGVLPVARELLEDGGRLYAYDRPAGPPATFWASVATGRSAPEHGVAAVDSFRPLGVRTPLARSGPLRFYWSGFAVPLGLARHSPLLANRRTAFTAWELAAHGGSPVVAVNWWATFPAEALPGLVVAHGAYQLLPEDPAAAVAPDRWSAAMGALWRRTAAAVLDGSEPLGRALPEEATDFLARAVVGPDRFYRQALLEGLEPHTRAAALYLAGPDIAAAGWGWADLAFGDLLRGELVATDRVLGRALDVQRPGTVLLVFDPGRRGGGEGRVLLWRRGGCGEGAGGEHPEAAGEASAGPAPGIVPGPLPTMDPRAVASAVLRALDLPQSRELPPPPGGCAWGLANSHLDTYGRRREPDRTGRQGEEYLESLRALGYL